MIDGELVLLAEHKDLRNSREITHDLLKLVDKMPILLSFVEIIHVSINDEKRDNSLTVIDNYW